MPVRPKKMHSFITRLKIIIMSLVIIIVIPFVYFVFSSFNLQIHNQIDAKGNSHIDAFFNLISDARIKLENTADYHIPDEVEMHIDEMISYFDANPFTSIATKNYRGMLITENGKALYSQGGNSLTILREWLDEGGQRLLESKGVFCTSIASLGCGQYLTVKLKVMYGRQFYISFYNTFQNSIEDMYRQDVEFAGLVKYQPNHEHKIVIRNLSHSSELPIDEPEEWATYIEDIVKNKKVIVETNEKSIAIFYADVSESIYVVVGVDVRNEVTENFNSKIFLLILGGAALTLLLCVLLFGVRRITYAFNYFTKSLDFIGDDTKDFKDMTESHYVNKYTEAYNTSLRIKLIDKKIRSKNVDLKEALIQQKAATATEFIRFRTSEITGFPNKLKFKEDIDDGLFNTKCTLLLFDIEKMKTINDAVGNELGDEFIRKAAKVFCNSPLDIELYSFDIDVIAAVFKGEDESTTKISTMNQFLTEEFSKPIVVGKHDLHCSFNVGVADISAEDDCAELLLKAFYALNKAKNSGSHLCYYDQSVEQSRADDSFVSREFYSAIENNELSLYLQPKIDFTDGSLTGAEALIRWNHPEKGLLSPGVFLPVVSSTNLMIELTYWVVKESSRMARELKSLNLNIPIAINLPPSVLTIESFEPFLLKTLQDHQLSPNDIELELTEDTGIDSPEMIAQIKVYLDMGFTISLDDFGTGYSSLYNLSQLPISKIKIDQSFIRGLVHDKVKQVVVKSVLAIAKEIKLSVIAEGVEEIEESNLLKDIGCPEGQGYLFSKPVSMVELIEKVVSDSGKVFFQERIMFKDVSDARDVDSTS
ncbi:MAG: diguanylate cyclase (GGDEF)-like protein [Oleiphilaceae bacterium]|jgi:diguanylate cyclase (GGDEF)-like protein